jgi:hypothetical protein
MSTATSSLMKRCVSLEVANQFQTQINNIVEVLNSVPAQIADAESRVGTLLRGLSSAPDSIPMTNLPEGLVMQNDLKHLQDQVDAHVEVHSKFCADTNQHVEDFLERFMQLPNFTMMTCYTYMAGELAKDAKAKADAVEKRPRRDQS